MYALPCYFATTVKQLRYRDAIVLFISQQPFSLPLALRLQRQNRDERTLLFSAESSKRRPLNDPVYFYPVLPFSCGARQVGLLVSDRIGEEAEGSHGRWSTPSAALRLETRTLAAGTVACRFMLCTNSGTRWRAMRANQLTHPRLKSFQESRTGEETPRNSST